MSCGANHGLLAKSQRPASRASAFGHSDLRQGISIALPLGRLPRDSRRSYMAVPESAGERECSVRGTVTTRLRDQSPPSFLVASLDSIFSLPRRQERGRGPALQGYLVSF